MRKFSNKSVDKIKTHFYAQQIFSENRAIFEIKWRNMVQPDKPQMTNYGTCALRAG
jgi:hypothetical protein